MYINPFQKRSVHGTFRRTAFTLIELVVVMAVIAVMTTAAIPSFRVTMERAKTDQASSNLKAIWSAQQLFWLENRTYASSLAQLQSLGMIDNSLLSTNDDYAYSIQSAGASVFTAAAVRRGSSQWTGTLFIDQSGTLTGSIKSSGLPSILPTY